MTTIYFGQSQPSGRNWAAHEIQEGEASMRQQTLRMSIGGYGLVLVCAVIFAALIFAAPPAWSQTETTILTFTGSNGSGPYTGLIQDAKGNFYGATINGGTNGAGAVYKVVLNARGKWKQTILYEFGPQPGTDGAYPQMPWLAIDKQGHLYGTTPGGGAHGQGMVFKLSPGKPMWKETILYSFTGAADGGQPIGGVTLDSDGNVYGTTNSGGGSQNCGGGCGVVFKISPGKKKTWDYSVLHVFTGYPSGGGCGDYDGANPYRATLAIDTMGNLFGTTQVGGNSCNAAGTVWELSPAQGGGWEYSVLHVQGQLVGDVYPDAGVALDSKDNLYLAVGGGSIFELVKAQGYQEQSIYQYPGPGAEDDYDTVNFDKAGNLYWTSQGGGGLGYHGTVEELSPNGQGGWTHALLWAFADNPAVDGDQPIAGVMVDASGHVYGTCSTGGGSQGSGQGTVFEITP